VIKTSKTSTSDLRVNLLKLISDAEEIDTRTAVQNAILDLTPRVLSFIQDRRVQEEDETLFGDISEALGSNLFGLIEVVRQLIGREGDFAPDDVSTLFDFQERLVQELSGSTASSRDSYVVYLSATALYITISEIL
jgi:hypothetical protein